MSPSQSGTSSSNFLEPTKPSPPSSPKNGILPKRNLQSDNHNDQSEQNRPSNTGSSKEHIEMSEISSPQKLPPPLPKYFDTRSSESYSTAKALLMKLEVKSAQGSPFSKLNTLYEEVIDTICSAIASTLSRLPPHKDSELDQSLAPFYYLYGSALLSRVDAREYMDEDTESENDWNLAVEKLILARMLTLACIEGYSAESDFDINDSSTEDIDAATDSVPHFDQDQSTSTSGTRKYIELHMDLSNIYLRLGDCNMCSQSQRPDKALKDYVACLQIREKVLGQYHKLIHDAHLKVAIVYDFVRADIKGRDKDMENMCRERILSHHLERARSIAGVIAIFCGGDPDQVTKIIHEDEVDSEKLEAIDGKEKPGVDSYSAKKASTGLKTTGLDEEEYTDNISHKEKQKLQQSKMRRHVWKQLEYIQTRVMDLTSQLGWEECDEVMDLENILDSIQADIWEVLEQDRLTSNVPSSVKDASSSDIAAMFAAVEGPDEDEQMRIAIQLSLEDSVTSNNIGTFKNSATSVSDEGAMKEVTITDNVTETTSKITEIVNDETTRKTHITSVSIPVATYKSGDMNSTVSALAGENETGIDKKAGSVPSLDQLDRHGKSQCAGSAGDSEDGNRQKLGTTAHSSAFKEKFKSSDSYKSSMTTEQKYDENVRDDERKNNKTQRDVENCELELKSDFKRTKIDV